MVAWKLRKIKIMTLIQFQSEISKKPKYYSKISNIPIFSMKDSSYNKEPYSAFQIHQDLSPRKFQSQKVLRH